MYVRMSLRLNVHLFVCCCFFLTQNNGLVVMHNPRLHWQHERKRLQSVCQQNVDRQGRPIHHGDGHRTGSVGPQIQERERGRLLKKKNEIVNTTFTHTSTWCSILWVRILRPGSRCWQWCLKINHLVWREKEMVWRDERKWRLEVTGCYTDVRSTAICL